MYDSVLVPSGKLTPEIVMIFGIDPVWITYDLLKAFEYVGVSFNPTQPILRRHYQLQGNFIICRNATEVRRALAFQTFGES